jgi:hypothetical protein
MAQENPNLRIYEQVRQVPQTAQKQITGGRLNGMTDINPMWRIKTLTEVYGPCGIGWYTEIKEQRLERGSDDSVAAFVTIDLYVKDGDEWSKPIPGTGGSMFVAKERSGLYTDDECFKKAYTDALSVACKALGVGADVYWDKDRTKYDKTQQDDDKPKSQVSVTTGGKRKEPTPGGYVVFTKIEQFNGKTLEEIDSMDEGRDFFTTVMASQPEPNTRQAALKDAVARYLEQRKVSA